jgi:hypothetical protein
MDAYQILDEGYDENSEDYPRMVGIIPIRNIGELLVFFTDTINLITSSHVMNYELANRLYYSIVCLKRFFPRWSLGIRPILRIRDHRGYASDSNRSRSNSSESSGEEHLI